MLGQMLYRAGIDTVTVEARSQEYVEGRIRAGVLEQGTVALLSEMGVGERLAREGLIHEGTNIRFADETHHIDFRALTGYGITVYGQHEVVKDLVAARLAAGLPLIFEAENVQPQGMDTDAPAIKFRTRGVDHRLDCDFIAGCDGFHGVCRDAVPPGCISIVQRNYPFGWFGILAELEPVDRELIYANHPRGFALASMRSPSVSRLYLQCAPDEDPEAWSTERIWSELSIRLGVERGRLTGGHIQQKSVTPMRSFVAEPIRFGRMFLVGDAAHIVPPAGAKGLNLAAGDVAVLAKALVAYFRTGDTSGLDSYSDTALRRVWRMQRFSWWFTTLLHRFETDNDFDRRIQLAALEEIVTSRAAATAFAETYVGLPFA
jgi:p-hydroxybenzoate 3-monooxygenase